MDNNISFRVQHLKSDKVYDSLELAKEAILSLTNVNDSELVVSRYSADDGKIKSVVGICHKDLSNESGWTIYSYDDDLVDITVKKLELPKDGLIDQVLTLTSDGVAWKDVPVKDTQPTTPTDSFWVRGTGEGATTGLAIKGRNSVVTGNYAFSDGYMSSATTTLAYASGQGNLSQNKLEVSFGEFNVSKKHSDTFGDSDNTLFTIGNGYTDIYSGKRYSHNALEVRQNGDIYFPDVVEGENFGEYAMRRLQDIPKVWKGTWDEYSKLEKLDNNTLYYIYESSLKNMYPESDLSDFGSYKPIEVPGVDFEFFEE